MYQATFDVRAVEQARAPSSWELWYRERFQDHRCRSIMHSSFRTAKSAAW